MTEPLDVALRIRLAYEAGRTAERVKTDLQQIRAEAERLGKGTGGADLARDLDRAGRPAEAARQRITEVARATQPARRDVAELQAQLTRMGAARLGAGLGDEIKAIGRAARTSSRHVQSIVVAAEKLGGVTLGSRYGSDLEALGRRADEARLKIDHLNEAMRAGGRGGLRMPGGGGHGGGRERGFEGDFVEGADLASALKYGAVGYAAGRALRMTGEALKSSAEHAITFETSMAEVAKAADDLSPDQLRGLRSTIQSLSRATGVDQNKIAASVAQAGYAGRPTADLPAFAALAAKTAPAWGVSSDQAGDTLAKFGNVYHFDQAGIADAANTVDYLGNKTAAKERDIAEYSMRTGPTAQLAGLNFRQNAALGATMLSQGIEAERSSTAANAILEKLTTRNKGDKNYQEGLRDLHMNARGLIASLKEDPGKGLTTFFEALSKSKNPLETAVKLFGREHADEASALAKAYQQLATNLGYAADQGARAGSIDKSFSIYSDTTRAKIDKMSTAIETLATMYGRKLEPAIAKAAETMARWAGGMAKDMERGEHIDAIAGKVMRHQRLTPEEAAELEKDPDLKSKVDIRAFGKAARTPEGQKALREGWNGRDYNVPLPVPPESEDRQDRARQPEQRSWFHQLFQRSAYSDDGDLNQAARTGMADYRDELDRGLDRTSRMVHAYAEKMRADLVLKARFDGDIDGLGGGGVIRASYGGGGGGLGRRSAGGGDFGIRTRGGGRFNGLGGDGKSGAGGRGRPTAPRPGGPATPLGRTGAAFAGKAPAIMRGLMDRYGLTREQAAGVLGNLGHESAGFTAYHEGGKASNRGGVGWAQWTGSRRRDFEQWTKERGLDPRSDEASWRYLTEGDPETPGAMAAVKKESTRRGATRAFERNFERAGIKAYGSRDTFADRAYELGPADPAKPASVARAPRDRLPSEATRSPRFQEPDQLRVDTGAAAGTGTAGRRQVAMNGGPPAIQHFYGGFDEVAVARRSQLESNRQIRRSYARALHDVGSLA